MYSISLREKYNNNNNFFYLQKDRVNCQHFSLFEGNKVKKYAFSWGIRRSHNSSTIALAQESQYENLKREIVEKSKSSYVRTCNGAYSPQDSVNKVF